MKPVLNLYATLKEAKEAFNIAADEDCVWVRGRDMRIDTEDTMTYFRYYRSYEDARHNELCQQWGEINFFVELPENVKMHYLSRIRWVKGSN